MRTPDEVAHMSIAVCCHDEASFSMFDTDGAANAIQADRRQLVLDILAEMSELLSSQGENRAEGMVRSRLERRAQTLTPPYTEPT
jgi:hypothetical protein